MMIGLELLDEARQYDWRKSRMRSLAQYALPNDEVHVWRTRLNWSPHCIRELRNLRSTLLPDERQKADNFYFEIDRGRYVVGRGLLRVLLGQLLDTRPNKLRFEYNAFGKPSLSGGPVENRLQFNVSHSGDLVLIALTIGRSIGVDMERVRTRLAIDEIANQYFSARERAELTKLDPSVRHDAFFTCWSRKEAFLKARGDGLRLPLGCFDVSLLPGQPAALLATRPVPSESGRWALRELDVGRDYKAAVAVEGSDWQLRTWDWPADVCAPVSAPCEFAVD